MFGTTRNAKLLILVLALACLVVGGCGASDGEASQAAAENNPHAGHDHGPGEHGEVATTASSGSTEVDDWCAEHRVPESACTQCNPELIEGFKATGDWCAGHDLPESHCRLCNPGIEFPREVTLRLAELDINEDEVEVTLLFRPNAESCATDGALIQFASAGTVERAGIESVPVLAAPLDAGFEAPAEVAFDETHATVVTTTVPALVSRWLIAPGDAVNAGQSLAVLQSPKIAERQAEFLSAVATNEVQEKELARHEQLRAADLISVADFERELAQTEVTRAELTGARGLLLSAGMSGDDIEQLQQDREVSSKFLLHAPASGLVVERLAQLGELLDAGRAFAILADPNSMWIEARLTEEQLRLAAVGQPLTYSSDGRGLHRIGGKVIWVSRFLDPHSRTGTVRAEVLDREHGLQAGEFGRARFNIAEGDEVLLVPRDAIQWEGCCNVVFVKETTDRYRPRKVCFTQASGPYYQVTEGLQRGEEVVVAGAFLLKTELKKTSLGAGCCGLDPIG